MARRPPKRGALIASNAQFDYALYAKRARLRKYKVKPLLDKAKLTVAIQEVWRLIMEYAKPDRPVLVALLRKLSPVSGAYLAAALLALKKADKLIISEDAKTVIPVYQK